MIRIVWSEAINDAWRAEDDVGDPDAWLEKFGGTFDDSVFNIGTKDAVYIIFENDADATVFRLRFGL